MASTKSYLDFVLEQLSELDGLQTRPMMGEYVLYYQGKVVGGVYDNRLLLKPTKTALRLVHDSGNAVQWELPYDGAKEMLAADIDNPAETCRLIRAIAADLPMPKKSKGKMKL